MDKEQQFVRTHRAELTLAGAEQAIAACRKQAEMMGVKENIAVVDDGGHLLAFARMDGARPSSVYTAITKATSAATQRAATGPLHPDEPGGILLSLAIEHAAAISGGKTTTLKGGVPIEFDGQVIGAIGVGGGTGEQDAKVAAAGVAKLNTLFENAMNGDKPPQTSLYRKWLVEDIAGRGVIDMAQTTIEIDNDGAVAGSTAVNRYMAKATIDGQKLEIEPGTATTRMAGPPALMDQESKFLAALSKVNQYRIDKNGLLHLLDSRGKELLRASPMK